MKRVLIIGLDGGDLRILTSLQEAGRLKALPNAMKQGCFGKLKSTVPAITIPAWPAMFSGKNAGQLGAVGFSRLERDYSLTLFTSLHWEKDMIWTILGEEGIKVGLINVPGTNPVYRVNGFAIASDFGSFETYPKDLGIEMKLRPLERCITNAQMLRAARHNFVQRTRGVLGLMRERDWNLFIWVIRISDIAMHLGDERDIEEAYVLADRYLEDILKLAEEKDCNIFIASDHGARLVEKVFNINTFLEEAGYLEFDEQEKDKGAFIKFASVLLKLHLKPLLMAGYRLLSRLTKKASQLDPGALSVEIQWDKTKAFTLTDTTSNFMGIWINSESNFADGIVSSDEEEDVKEELIKRLTQLCDGGKRVVKEVWRKELLYPGSSRYIPDLFVETAEGYAPDFRSYNRVIVHNKKYIHDPYGIFIAYGPDIAHHREELGDLEITDIAPTILHLFGLPIPTAVDGRVIKEIWRPESEVVRREIRYREYPHEDKEKTRMPTAAEKELIRKRLKDLGYLG